MPRRARKTRQDPDLFALAKQRGLEVHAGTDNHELNDLLGPTPPSNAQVLYASDLARDLGYSTDPVLRSYGHARVVLKDLETLCNKNVLAKTGWEEGDVVKWRSKFWRIVNIRPERLYCRLYIIEVDLEPDDDGVQIVDRRIPHETHSARTLHHDGARKIDTTTWPPKPIQDEGEAPS